MSMDAVAVAALTGPEAIVGRLILSQARGGADIVGGGVDTGLGPATFSPAFRSAWTAASAVAGPDLIDSITVCVMGVRDLVLQSIAVLPGDETIVRATIDVFTTETTGGLRVPSSRERTDFVMVHDSDQWLIDDIRYNFMAPGLAATQYRLPSLRQSMAALTSS